MPEVLRVRGYRFFFFSREGHQPRHIHVEQAERYAKFWLEPIELVEARGFRGSELRELYSIIEEHRDNQLVVGAPNIDSVSHRFTGQSAHLKQCAQRLFAES
jgi:hypothetical protein